MKAMKILVVVTALVVIAGLTTSAWAACAPARVFRSVGAPVTVNTKFFQNGSAMAGDQIGYFWDSDNSDNSNSWGTGVPADSALCPDSVWWLPAGVNWKIDGSQGGTGCGAAGCPTLNMSLVIEDYTAGAGPGFDSGSNAFYMGFMVEATSGSSRWWDYGLIDGITAASTVNLLQFPDVVINDSSRIGANISIDYSNLDQTNNNHTWKASADSVYPTVDVVKEWQLVKFTGNADPGRARSLGWVTIQSVAYSPGGSNQVFLVPCSNPAATDEWLAVGIGFNAGTGSAPLNVIDSVLVGRAIPLECNENIAQPDGPVDMQKKPAATELQSKPGRKGGRR